MLRVATIVEATEAEGPGRRWALWLQGCPLRCPGCCNPEMFDATGGTAVAVADLAARAIASGCDGVTLLGGEPFAQAPAAARLAAAVRRAGKNVMVFTGYTVAELATQPDAAGLLAVTDLLVDGRYDRSQPEPAPPEGRRWIGSRNQLMHFLSDAYRADDPQFRTANTVEVRWSAAGLVLNGWPAGAQALRPRRGGSAP